MKKEVIDTFEKFEKFLSNNELWYEPNKTFIISSYDKCFNMEEAEIEFNVDLQIMKY